MTARLSLCSEDYVTRALETLPSADAQSVSDAEARQADLTKPQGSLGQLEYLAFWLAAWQGAGAIRACRPQCLVFAGNHGVASRGVSAYPPEVTAQMVANFEAGGAAINQLCRKAGAELSVVPLDINRPTMDLSQEAAMSAEECGAAFQAGADAVSPHSDILLLGEMGIGNTTAAAALAFATFGGSAGDWTGPGTGLDHQGVSQKARLVEQAVSARREPGQSAFEVMRQFGGRELAAIAGATLAARHLRIPVLLDGFVSTAAAAVLTIDNQQALDHCQISHLSSEPGHKRVAVQLGLSPILDLDMRLGEASGAALACLIVQAAAAVHEGMATFSEAGVTDIEK